MPPQFNYLTELVAKFGKNSVRVRGTGHDFVDQLSLADIEELAAGYEEISRRGDGPAISHWLDEADSQMDPDAERIWLLMVLFHQLRETEKAPFSSGDVRLLPKIHPPRDWKKLPAELHYLVPAAEKYGVIQFEEDVDKFVAKASASQLNELSPLAQRAHKDMSKIDRWLDEFRMTKHREAALVYFLTVLLNRLGLL